MSVLGRAGAVPQTEEPAAWRARLQPEEPRVRLDPRQPGVRAVWQAREEARGEMARWVQEVSQGGTAGAAGGPVVAPGGTGKSGEAAGISGSPAANCNATHPTPPALITNFSDAMASTTSKGNYTFGSSGVAAGMMGGTSLYSSGTTGTLSVSGGMLTFTGTVPPPTTADMTPYSGFVSAGPDCLSAGIFYGVKLTYMSTGPCPVLYRHR